MKPKNGYNILYQNVGVYAGITDRGCDGGTITFMKNPQTGDRAPPLLLWVGMILIGTAAAGMALGAGRKKKLNRQ